MMQVEETEDLSNTEPEETVEAAPEAADKAPAEKTIAAPAEGDKAKPTDKPAAQGKTIATGADAEAEAKAKEEAVNKAAAAKVDPWKLTDDVRKAIAEHYAAGDKKVYEREMKRLARMDDIRHVWGSYRELENWRNEGGFIKLPGKDAKPEDIAAFHKAIGVPEKPEGYIEHIKLENGAVIGDADKPVLASFTQALHKAGAPPSVVNAAANWYYQQQEEAAAKLDDADNAFRIEAEKALKEELGAAYPRKTRAIASLFATAPGGADPSNPNSLMARLMGGRTADGRITGNDPDVIRFLLGLVSEINPVATVVEDGNQSGMSIDQEIAAIEKRMREDRAGYNKDYKMQARYLELLDAQQKYQARSRA